MNCARQKSHTALTQKRGCTLKQSHTQDSLDPSMTPTRHTPRLLPKGSSLCYGLDMTNHISGHPATPCLIASQVSHHVARNILIAGAGYGCVNTLVTKILLVCDWTLMSAWRALHPQSRPARTIVGLIHPLAISK